MQSYFRKKIIPITWLVIVHVLLLMPIKANREEKLVLFAQFDKLIHFGLYAVLTTVWTIFISQLDTLSPKQKSGLLVIIVLLAIGDGIAIEFLQKTSFIHRDFDWFDAVADGLGAIAGIIAGQFFLRKLSA